MQRRNFFKKLIASIVGIFAVSKKTAKAQDKPQTTLRFNENRIEAWNGGEWQAVIEIELAPMADSCCIQHWHDKIYMTIPSPTTESWNPEKPVHKIRKNV